MKELAGLLSEIAALQARAQQALNHGDVDAWMQLTRELRLLEQRRDRAWERVAAKVDAGTAAVATGSARDQARRVLDDVRVPTALNQISAWHFAIHGIDIPYKALSSLRHDEGSSFRRAANSRPWYIVPALSTDTFTPVRGLLALSDWAPVDRLVGPLTQRTAHLRITLALTDAINRLDGEAPVAVERLLWRFASTLPGARQRDLTADAVRSGAADELAQLADIDRVDREGALERFARLPAREALFGAALREAGRRARTGSLKETR